MARAASNAAQVDLNPNRPTATGWAVPVEVYQNVSNSYRWKVSMPGGLQRTISMVRCRKIELCVERVRSQRTRGISF